MAFSMLVIATGISAGMSTAAMAEEPAATADTFFTNDKGISLDSGYLVFATPYSKPVTETLTLTATQDLTLESTTEYPTPGDRFHITRTGVCPTSFGTVTMRTGDSCTLNIDFTPEMVRYFYGETDFTITANGVTTDFSVGFQAHVQTVVLTGDATFGSVPFGTSVTSQIEFANITDYDFHITDLLVNMSPSYGLSIQATTCGTVIAAHATCTLDLQFQPEHTFDINRQVFARGTIEGKNAISSAIEVSARGDEGPVSLTATPSVDFGTLEPESSATDTITITNTGEIALGLFTDYSWFNDTTGNFTIEGSLPETLEPGSAVDVSVRFTAPADSEGEHLSKLNLVSFTPNFSYADASVALRANVASKDSPVTPTTPETPSETLDPQQPEFPVAPEQPVIPAPPVAPESILPEEETVIVPASTNKGSDPADHAAPGAVPSADSSATQQLASTGAENNLFLLVGLLVVAGSLAIRKAKRAAPHNQLID
ncbi:choice-of-anchor D domain-containing protein [Lysinibacter cavernae]|uniref:LPXTG-motif cell wall-anchored protein n=2 Tax=Lysinibacter cavernae TaxID=1640652 RepID=A0A7X5TSX8_9MICO|nr:choice-of-anchor D domain-containing protein [Lysinibacter cavernae]NIH53545.1 LPXTG-motif cell wall-anchored protein [Lysinibacter cavernae]